MVRVIVHHLGASLLSTPFQLYVILPTPMVLGGVRVYRTCKVCQRRGPSALQLGGGCHPCGVRLFSGIVALRLSMFL